MNVLNLIVALARSGPSGTDRERNLMRRVKAGDAEALEELYDLYNSLLYGLIFSIVREREEAEDLLQEVFLKIWEKAHTFDGQKGSVYGWIVTMSRNRAIDRIRSRSFQKGRQTSRYPEQDSLVPAGGRPDPLETTILSDRADLVKNALLEIPEAEREVIRAAYYQGMTQSEIAEHMDMPLGTVKTRTRQGLIKLKDILSLYISQNDR